MNLENQDNLINSNNTCKKTFASINKKGALSMNVGYLVKISYDMLNYDDEEECTIDGMDFIEVRDGTMVQAKNLEIGMALPIYYDEVCDRNVYREISSINFWLIKNI